MGGQRREGLSVPGGWDDLVKDPDCHAEEVGLSCGKSPVVSNSRVWYVACLQVNREQTQPGVQTGYLTGSVSRGVCGGCRVSAVTLGAYGEDGAEERLAIGDQVVMGMMVEERVGDWVVMSVMMEEREGGPRSRAES